MQSQKQLWNPAQTKTAPAARHSELTALHLLLQLLATQSVSTWNLLLHRQKHMCQHPGALPTWLRASFIESRVVGQPSVGLLPLPSAV